MYICIFFKCEEFAKSTTKNEHKKPRLTQNVDPQNLSIPEDSSIRVGD